MNFFSLFKSLLLDNSAESSKVTKTIRRLLNSADDRYWRSRYNFEGGNSLSADFFGRDRVNRFTGNILIPIFLHYAREKKSRRLESSLVEIAGSLPAAHNKFTKKIYYSWNEETRKTMKMTFLLEQGLLGHYANFCTPQRCERCKSICDIR